MLTLSCFARTHADRVVDASDEFVMRPAGARILKRSVGRLHTVDRLEGLVSGQSFWAELAADAAAFHPAERRRDVELVAVDADRPGGYLAGHVGGVVRVCRPH